MVKEHCALITFHNTPESVLPRLYFLCLLVEPLLQHAFNFSPLMEQPIPGVEDLPDYPFCGISLCFMSAVHCAVSST